MKNTIKKYQNTFVDADVYSANIRLGQVEHYQLEPGLFAGENSQVVSDKVILAKLKTNRTLFEVGYGLNGFTIFLLPGDVEQSFSWRKQRLNGKRIGLLKSMMKHYSVIPPNFFGTPIGIENNYLKELILKLSFDENLFQLIQQTEIVEIDLNDARQIQGIVIKLCESTEPNPVTLIEKLPLMLLKSIEKKSEKMPGHISGSRDIVFGRAVSYIDDNINQKINTSILCENLDLSERSLRYLFREMTGLSPMNFVKNMKLGKVRKEIRGLKANEKIGTVAIKWGFNQSGQFAADYEKLFGELPTETATKNIKPTTAGK